MGTITVKGVGKAYKAYSSRWARLKEWFFPFGGDRHQKHWALRGIDLEIGVGESVGIAGVNGAGKSTLLKLITGTVVPTEGEITLTGHVAALLELGMGFHPDFTGRQNVYMSGQILGLSSHEITGLMPAIEDFAEIGDYIDKPVRTYSSGMQMRLAFSVATARRPEVLIVDEALSVGDAYFQHKSFDRIRQYRERGTTLLIVSHNRAAIQSICERVVLLDQGKLLKQGSPEEVLDYYHALLAKRERTFIKQLYQSDGTVQTISGTGEVAATSFSLCDMAGQTIEVVPIGETVRLKIDVEICKDVPALVVGFLVKDQFGQNIYGINTERTEQRIDHPVSGENYSFIFDIGIALGTGNYSIAIALHQTDSHLDKNYEWRDRALLFSVINTGVERFVGNAWLDVKSSVESDGKLISSKTLGRPL